MTPKELRKLTSQVLEFDNLWRLLENDIENLNDRTFSNHYEVAKENISELWFLLFRELNTIEKEEKSEELKTKKDYL